MRKTLDVTQSIASSGVSAEKWFALLTELTDAELEKYGEIAKDQCNQELERLWLQILSGIAVLAALSIGVNEGLRNGMTGLAAICVTLSGVLGFWLFQKSRTRRFWNKHCAAMANEKTRRAAKVELKAD